jgi:hypothetical protein
MSGSGEPPSWMFTAAQRERRRKRAAVPRAFSVNEIWTLKAEGIASIKDL